MKNAGIFSLTFFSILFVALAAGWLTLTLKDLPFSSIAENHAEPAIMLAASDGTEIPHSGPDRDRPATRGRIPQHLVDAVVAIEDRRFYHHPGIDLLGIARAATVNLDAGTIIEGGSTITQQLVRARALNNDRTLRRKVREAALALWLETKATKDRILMDYLNTAYFGSGYYGISAAAHGYFGKEAQDLSVAESAVLAGLLKSPSGNNPTTNRDAALDRARLVVAAMEEAGSLSQVRARRVTGRIDDLAFGDARRKAQGSWFGDWVDGRAEKLASTGPFSSGDTVHIQTTLDPELQEFAERSIAQFIDQEARNRGATQAALVAMRPDGAVMAMVGGTSYEESQFNRAVQAKRQPGSLFKLFVYHAALENGWRPDDVLSDSPLEIGDWAPENYDKRYVGRIQLASAFAQSRNVPAVRLARKVGIDQVVEAARDLGLDAPLDETPSLALGVSEVDLLDITAAFAAVRAGRTPVDPWGIGGISNGRTDRYFKPGRNTGQTASAGPHRGELISMLRRTVESGTGTNAALEGEFVAGKTGTSENYRDAWFVGFTDNLIAGVWVGNDKNKPMDRVTGGQLPAKIWQRFMAKAEPMLEDRQSSSSPLLASATGPGSRAQCDEKACERAYRSFRASDCTYQPYSGPRQLCTKGSGKAQQFAMSEAPENSEGSQWARSCNVAACERAYRSFRASDCTYQPYSGPRQICTKEPASIGQSDNRRIAGNRAGSSSSCNISACQREYRSFRASDCTFQPYSGPRRKCTVGNSDRNIATGGERNRSRRNGGRQKPTNLIQILFGRDQNRSDRPRRENP